MTFDVLARRVDAQGSVATSKDATLVLDTALAGRPDAFNPAELLLAALSACIIKGIERVTPMLKFEARAVEVRVHGVRQDVPPTVGRITLEAFLQRVCRHPQQAHPGRRLGPRCRIKRTVEDLYPCG